MRTDAILRNEAIDLLIETFGALETERFITSIKNSKFDYTEWQRHLWKDKSIDELHNMAVNLEKNKR